MDLRGPSALLVDHYELSQPDHFTHTGGAAEATGDLTKGFLAAQALTIAGGTTNINKNVVADRILGLPSDRGRATEAKRHR